MVNQRGCDLTLYIYYLLVLLLVLTDKIHSSDRFHPIRQVKANNDPIDPTGNQSPGIVIVYKKSGGGGGGGDYDRDNLHSHRPHYEDSSHHSSHPHPNRHNDLRPSCANTGGFYCSYDRDDYPMDKIKTVADQFRPRLTDLYEELNHYPLDQYISHDNSSHSYRHKGHFICESEVSYVRPGWAKNWKGEWVTVLNTDVFPQSVRIETCKYANKRCDYVTACYKSYCVQRYTYVKLICVDPYNSDKRPSVDVFEIPSACSCFVENFSLYK